MTRIKPRWIDKIKAGLGAVDKSFSDRGDPYDHTKIQRLEEKMNEKHLDGLNDVNKIKFGNIKTTHNKKINLKNSKRY